MEAKKLYWLGRRDLLKYRVGGGEAVVLEDLSRWVAVDIAMMMMMMAIVVLCLLARLVLIVISCKHLS